MRRVKHALWKIREWYSVSGRELIRTVGSKIGVASWLSPNWVTVAGTVMNVIAAVLIYHEMWLAAGIVFIVGSLFDAVDGAIAKIQGKVSAFGGFLDSTMDRISEGVVLLGLGLYFSNNDQTIALALCFIALAGSYLVSYTRARAESLGATAAVGFASRVERVIILAIGMILTHFWESSMAIAVGIVAVLSSYTVAQRVHHVHKSLKGKPMVPSTGLEPSPDDDADATTDADASDTPASDSDD